MSWLFWSLLMIGLALIVWPFFMSFATPAAAFLWVVGALFIIAAFFVLPTWWIRPNTPAPVRIDGNLRPPDSGPSV